METTIVKEKLPRPKIQRWLHTDFGLEIPYYDEEFDLAQSDEHGITINYLSSVFRFLAKELGLKAISDHPVWYLIPPSYQKGKKVQKNIYPDLCVSTVLDISRIGQTRLLKY